MANSCTNSCGQRIATLEAQLAAAQQHHSYLQIINDFAVAISTFNTIDEIVWGIAKHAVARMQFDDCVVYLMDSARQTLIQRAAHGPKNPLEFEIKDPISIPLGQGIVGSVAQTAKPALVTDTRFDKRYILDDDFRLSELAVPIIYEGLVLGVIDSENAQAGFYTRQHLEILTTLAALSAPRIAYIAATESALQLSERQLSDCSDQLADTLRQLQVVQTQLAKMQESADAGAKTQSQFISQMSHELRTPLTSMIGYLHILQHKTELSSRQVRCVNTIDKSSKRLLNIVNDILQFSKHDRANLKLQAAPVHLPEFIESVVALVEADAVAKQLELHILLAPDLPQDIRLDASRLRQALVNLLSNAIKFTVKGSVTLAISAEVGSSAENATFHFTIQDTGIGIGPEAYERIFQPFEQANTQMGLAKGSGLGLTISQQIITAMGGHITVSSALGKGSTFAFSLDLAVAPSNTSLLTPTLDGGWPYHQYAGRTRKLLLIDPSTYRRAQLADLLNGFGFELYEATDSLDAAAHAYATRPDLIIAYQSEDALIAEQLKAHHPFHQIPILIVSTSPPANTTDAQFLLAPFSTHELMSTINSHLQLEWGVDAQTVVASTAQRQ